MNMINRQCPECGGYELDNGVDDVCECYDDENDVVDCANGCGEGVNLGGFCSTQCRLEYEMENGICDD